MAYFIKSVESDAPTRTAFTKMYDYDVSGNLIYEGFALSSLVPVAANAVWAIRRNNYNGSAQLISSQWAGGSTNTTQIWNNRVGLSYS